MTKSRTPLFSRRSLLRGAAALSGAGAVGLPRRTRSQSKGKIVLGIWGGDYARLLNKNVEQAILMPAGWEVVQDQAGDPQRRSKMLAERLLPRGTCDIQGLTALNIHQMRVAGVLDEIDYSRLRNAGNLIPSMKSPYGIGHIFSGKVAVYNPALIADAPKSYRDVFDAKHGKKIGIIDIQYQYALVAAAVAAGGSPSNLAPGQKLLLEMRHAGARIYPTNEAFAQGLKTGEVGIGIIWKARAVQWQNADIPILAVTPSEGALAYVTGFAIPKNAPNKAGAYAYLDAMLEASAQEAFAIDMGYNPTVTNAKIAPDLNARIGFTADDVQKLVELDYQHMTENDAALKDWWDRAFKG